jgi:hypothetical protein
LFLTLVEEGERLRRGDGRWGNVPERAREALYAGWKAGNNGLAFGLLAQTNEVDLPGKLREEVSLLFDGGSIRAPLAHPLDPGAYACLPLAGLVTSCARLLQACVHRAVRDKGGLVAAGDTDSNHIIATETGGPVPVETIFSNRVSNSGTTWARISYAPALSRCQVEDLVALFEPLNPFDKKLMPGSPLKIQSHNLEALFIAEKCYCLLGPDGILADGKASILGMYLPPVENWVIEAWRYIVELWQEMPSGSERPWLDRPAVRAMPASAPAFWERVRSVAPQPFDLLLAAHVVGRKSNQKDRTAIVLAPFETDPEKWAGLPWIFDGTSERVPLGSPDAEGWHWRLDTIGDLLRGFVNRHPDDFLDAKGSACRRYTRGLLQRCSVRRGHKWVLTKESLTWSDDPALAFWTPQPEVFRTDGTRDAGPGQRRGVDLKIVRQALALIDPRAVAKNMGLTPRSGLYWASGSKLPHDPGKVIEAIVALVAKAGVLLPSNDPLSNEAICAELPGRVGAVAGFAAAMTALFAETHGSQRELARAMGIDRETVRCWLTLNQCEPPIRPINAIIAKLAKFARSEIRALRRRVTTDYGAAGDRQAIVAYLPLVYRMREPIIRSSAETLILAAALAPDTLSPVPTPHRNPGAFSDNIVRFLDTRNRELNRRGMESRARWLSPY